MYPYKVSVVMAVYNVELFLREAIDSVIAQDIGFENIQLILVDDGSPDGSGVICEEYAAKYPENIVVIHKENGGVSSARNAGLERAEGELVNFMDSDDKLSVNAVSAVYKFFKAHEDEVDVVTIPMKFFDAKKGEYVLNYIFKQGTRVVDLEQDWDHVYTSASSSFFRRACLADRRFDTRLTSYEDAHLLNSVLLSRQKFGVVREAVYWYRRRSTGPQSAVQSASHKKTSYVNFIKYHQKAIIASCLETFGMVPRYIRFLLMYELQWKLNLASIPHGTLTEGEKQEYFDLLHDVLQYIDDDIIDAQRHIYCEQKLMAYRLKYGDALNWEICGEDICLVAQNRVLLRISESPVMLDFYKNHEDGCTVEGRIAMPAEWMTDFQILVKVGGSYYESSRCGAGTAVLCMDQEVMRQKNFRIEVPLDTGKPIQIEFYCEAGGIRFPLKKIRYGRFFPVSDAFSHNFYGHKGWILTCGEGCLRLAPKKFGDILRHEAALCRELWKTGKKVPRNSVISRILLHILKPLKRKPLWLISDRAGKAGDNGEAFFRYVRAHHPEIDARFVIAKGTADYEAMQKIGPVVNKDSYGHKLLHLLSDCVISSHGDLDVRNPFYRSYEPYRSLLADDRFVFLQHGIIKDDMTHLFARLVVNFKGFVTAAEPEYQSILNGDYGYCTQKVWLTGLPRFDRLYQDSQKWITIMPTWRKSLAGTLDKHSGLWSLVDHAADTDYVQFYNGLLNHPRLHEAARRFDYRLKFLPHPNMQNHLDIFQANDEVEYLGRETRYRDIYAKSDLIVTDYSSAVFDFVYLRKPIIYTQFDSDTFFDGAHTVAKGYFDYERDGFGEVEYDLESTVDRIIEYLENGCQLKDKYRQRIDDFFAFNDQNNCQRVFDKIMELERKCFGE